MKAAAIAEKWQEVIKQGVGVLAVNPWDVPTLCAIASASGELTPLGEMEYYLLKCALEADPKAPDTNRQCALAMAERGFNDQAIACWHRVEMARPGDKEALDAIAELAVRTVGGPNPQKDSRPGV